MSYKTGLSASDQTVSLVQTPVRFPFWFGGSAASIATLFTHPLDLVKVRLQAAASTVKPSMMEVFTNVLRHEGAGGLYSGLSAALLRQLTYSTVRFGVYEELKARVKTSNSGATQTNILLIPLSATAGLLGGVCGTPADVVNVRMQSDTSRPMELRRNYKNAFDGLVRIARDEGAISLSRGVSANSARAALMNASQLASYDIFKGFLLRTFSMPDDTKTYLLASLLAGLTATTICSPIDVVKTRVMNSATSQSFWNVALQSSLREGNMWMFKGWLPSFIRLGPQTILTMYFFEQHKILYQKLKQQHEL